MSRIQGFDGQHLANAAWGFAHLQAMDPTLLAATCDLGIVEKILVLQWSCHCLCFGLHFGVSVLQKFG